MTDEKKTHGVSWAIRSLFILMLAGTLLVALLGGVLYWHFSQNLPEIITVADYRPLTVTRIYATGSAATTANDLLPKTVPIPQPSASPVALAPGAVAPAAIPSGGNATLIGEFYKERRYVIPYDKIPEVVVQAFISAEDDTFFTHQGVNVASIIRASIANAKAGHVVQGGSTITQQVAKSLLIAPEKGIAEKTLGRKIRELILSSRIEHNLTKQQILYLYLNQIYLGHGAYGVQAATNAYFAKDVSKITIAEAAMLAGMPQAPGKYSPLLSPKRAKERQLYVLRRMYENKYITQTQMTEAAGQGLHVYEEEDLNGKYSGYLTEHIRRHLVEKFGDKAVYEDGLIVTTPASADLMIAARKNLREGLRVVDKRTGYRGALKHLKDDQEIEKELKAQRTSQVNKKLGYQVLTPDGKLDPIASLKSAGLANESDLLSEDEVYPAVVTGVDDAKKIASVMMGANRAELPLSTMKWAKRPEPSVPSKVLQKGDLILVKPTRIAADTVQVALEQEPQVQGAIFSMDTRGNVLAMEGGYDFQKSEFNRAIQALRQPGSAFKPIIFTAAIEKGMTPASIIVDAPIVYEDKETGKWKPGNYEEKFYGDTTLRSALIKSRNVPTIKIVRAIQIPHLIDFAHRMGMTTQFPNDLSISLGSGTISLAELTKVYAIYPRLGRKVEPAFYSQIKSRDGKVLEEYKPKSAIDLSRFSSPQPMVATNGQPAPEPSPGASPLAVSTATTYPLVDDPDQVLDPRVAFIGSHLMKEVVSYGTGHEAKALGRPAAGKTGTTNDYIDAWFMGFTPQVITGVWVGYDNSKSIGPSETGARAALPIWLGFMKEAVKKYSEEEFTVPPGVVFANIDPLSGKLLPSNSSISIKEAFIEGTQPTETSATGTKNAKSQSEFFKEDIE